MKTFQELLEDLYACRTARDWAAAKTIEEVVAECHRGDWLLWLAAEVNVDKRKFTLAKAHCANTVRHLMKDERSLNAVDIAMAYGEGRATDEELRKATIAAFDVGGFAADAATSAANVANVASSYIAASAAASAAASVDYDAAYEATDADFDAAAYAAAIARSANQKQTADICREYIGQEIIEEVNEILNSKTI